MFVWTPPKSFWRETSLGKRATVAQSQLAEIDFHQQVQQLPAWLHSSPLRSVSSPNCVIFLVCDCSCWLLKWAPVLLNGMRQTFVPVFMNIPVSWHTTLTFKKEKNPWVSQSSSITLVKKNVSVEIWSRKFWCVLSVTVNDFQGIKMSKLVLYTPNEWVDCRSFGLDLFQGSFLTPVSVLYRLCCVEEWVGARITTDSKLSLLVYYNSSFKWKNSKLFDWLLLKTNIPNMPNVYSILPSIIGKAAVGSGWLGPPIPVGTNTDSKGQRSDSSQWHPTKDTQKWA